MVRLPAPDKVIGRKLATILTPASLAAVDERVRRAVAGERLPRTFEATLQDGTTVPSRLGAAHLRRGRQAGHTTACRDATERAGEAALRAGEARPRGRYRPDGTQVHDHRRITGESRHR
jgi:hypothetical protein